MSDTTRISETEPLRLNLCLTDDDLNRYSGPGPVFTCNGKYDGQVSFPCTGSAHKAGVHAVCTCACHNHRGPV